MFELTIIEEFEAAHRLPDYEGKCCRLHGHNWRVEVVVRGTELDSSGLLIDFKVLKSHVAEVLLTLDHYYLNETEAFLNWCNQFSIANDVSFTFTMQGDPETAPGYMAKYF